MDINPWGMKILHKTIYMGRCQGQKHALADSSLPQKNCDLCKGHSEHAPDTGYTFY